MKISSHPSLAQRRAGGAGLMILGLLLLVLVGGGGCYAVTYNGLMAMEESVDASFSEIDNQYKRRNDLIPQLVEAIKGATNYEESVLTEVVAARASVGQAQVPSDPEAQARYLEAQQNLGGALSRLLVVAEAYPDLKATNQFRDLQTQIEGTENRIAVARRDYIDSIKTFNSKLRGFPGNVIGGMAGLEKYEQMQAAAPAEREVPKIDFGDE